MTINFQSLLVPPRVNNLNYYSVNVAIASVVLIIIQLVVAICQYWWSCCSNYYIVVTIKFFEKILLVPPCSNKVSCYSVNIGVLP